MLEDLTAISGAIMPGYPNMRRHALTFSTDSSQLCNVNLSGDLIRLGEIALHARACIFNRNRT
ncbi:hypothetical protein [uncultured Sutterella sp.]|uniref:hypothetical protein n=1 Tax=uncultured Sutterella sp. TaxID=286133 RepID=UPI002631A351|nr:hypothetical protein [uncultured Sutterella sp.]